MYGIVLQRSEIKPVVAKESSARFCWRLFGCGSLSWINTPLFFAEISFMCFLRYHCAAATLSTRARRLERFEFYIVSSCFVCVCVASTLANLGSVGFGIIRTSTFIFMVV